jgi:hypothetical protein
LNGALDEIGDWAVAFFRADGGVPGTSPEASPLAKIIETIDNATIDNPTIDLRPGDVILFLTLH